MVVTDWITDNYIELFGAVTGIIFVFFEIRQNIWLWPVGIMTSAVYIWVFFTGKLYADMSLQGYYLVISILGWYWWVRGAGHRLRSEATKSRIAGAQGSGLRAQGSGQQVQGDVHKKLPSLEGLGLGIDNSAILVVSRIKLKTSIMLTIIFLFLYISMWYVLDNFTDSPVPGCDSFITSLSIIATWMLARKIIEHWYLWIIVNAVAVVLFLSRGLYPTVVLYSVYCAMSFIGLKEWRKTISQNSPFEEPAPPQRGG
ncbi:MAG: hypothetical protein A2X04_17265 [Bacteroidetes bacterium GWF2_41_9]|nr:MAG: hypothetical protein A2X03_07925 [Bacteroidetes bacterium GWA2_40_15]OFX95911.1 MAG: hypothetical protein A2X06_03780 [Bacteroidetes bacterium GWC2_40_22]OFY58141.1 MAG: hypothetical protein A2X04_17265 [Bacteroidetes bacterium GWF2_41_9]HBH85701.1 nicotinamide riboside transporter PnuC [Bacteroidales bacterium]HBQ81956.1 nicotinamide riboside transporter PnuC [Bacteroidales bacterium]